jgi:DNA-binding MarR family transcriptional regulator
LPAPRHSRRQLLKDLDETLRQVGAQSVLMSDLVATRVGLCSTDLECLDLLYLAGVTTAGRLAAHTGLTTGATTAAIDRLERAGFVRRRRDAEDRRCVLVEVLPSSGRRILPYYEPLIAGMGRLNEQYDDRQLAMVVKYMSEALSVWATHVAWLQKPRPAPRRTGPARKTKRTRRIAGRA